ncbi:MAG: shikimate kinase AroK [Gammaproteobacteria bacterium]|jgi:shikimate kinase
MTPAVSVFLIGPMGAGKSAVGRRLAHLLKRDFLDTDDEIERRTGVDIPFIFEKEGEAGFRRRERQVVAELSALPGIVLATGGGVVLDEANRRDLTVSGTVVYLHASVDQQLKRTRRGRGRPLLETEDPRQRLEDLMTIREPLYRAMADYVVDTNGRKVTAVAEEIRSRLGGD